MWLEAAWPGAAHAFLGGGPAHVSRIGSKPVTCCARMPVRRYTVCGFLCAWVLLSVDILLSRSVPRVAVKTSHSGQLLTGEVCGQCLDDLAWLSETLRVRRLMTDRHR